jgi:hypothetical protein
MANTELLHTVLRHIKNNPDQYDAVRWHADFAGWTLRLMVPGIEIRTERGDIEVMYYADGTRVWISDIGPTAQKMLGLTDGQAARLFHSGNTISELERLVAEFTAEVKA